jgi:predicted nucleic acid-binding protein
MFAALTGRLMINHKTVFGWMESEAVLLILKHVYADEWEWLISEVVVDEVEQTPDADRRHRLEQLLKYAQQSLVISDQHIERAKTLIQLSFGSMDALHLACAESGKADVFLTTDDKLLHRAKRLAGRVEVPVRNPLDWLREQKGL